MLADQHHLIANLRLGHRIQRHHALIHTHRTHHGHALSAHQTAIDAQNAAHSIRVAHHQDGGLIAKLISSDEAYATIQGPTKAARDRAWLEQAYQGIVEAAPTPAEVAKCTALFGAGSTVSKRTYVANVLEESPPNATSWTFGVYGAGLNRGASPDELAFWARWLNGRGHWQTFRMWTNVLSSHEAYELAQTQPAIAEPEH